MSDAIALEVVVYKPVCIHTTPVYHIHIYNTCLYTNYTCLLHIRLRIYTTHIHIASVLFIYIYAPVYYIHTYIHMCITYTYVHDIHICARHTHMSLHTHMCTTYTYVTIYTYPPKKLLSCEISTPYTPFCLICTIISELTHFPICTTME